ncbi:MAG: putative beta-barrel assembly-enhancing protease [Gammaproteobacteria bacterium]|nr:MAG: putative beta-barrel assembly-enhancing protease [Gammaproteobacteria bacterium]
MPTVLCRALLALGLAAATTLAAARADLDAQLPELGDPADRYLSPAQERELGAAFLRDVYRAGLVLEDAEVSAYIQHLGDELSNALARKPYPFTFFIVRDDAINAFAVPGGYIGVNSGLILASNNESELAAVLAHEIAHVAQRHIARAIAEAASGSTAALGAILAGMLIAMAGGSNADAGAALAYAGAAAQAQAQINYTRSNEIEADRIGLEILHRAGFDPNGMASFFRTMQLRRFGAIPREFQFILTHPLDETRIAEARARLAKLPPQPHADSPHYRYGKARLRALVHPEPIRLARELRRDVEALNKPDPVLLYALSQALERARDPAGAAAVLAPLLREDPENLSLQLAMARAELDQGKRAAAAARMEKLLALHPDHFAVVYHHALAQRGGPTPEKGWQPLKTLLEHRRPVILEAYRLLAELYEQDGRTVDARETIAEYYYQRGDTHAAVFQLRSALREPGLSTARRVVLERRLRQILDETRRDEQPRR